MTAARTPASGPVPPEHAGEACHNVALTLEYPMRTQRRPVRVVYMAAPDVLAVAALSDAYRALVRAGAGLVIQLAVGGSAVLTGLTGTVAGDGDVAAIAAVSGHSHSLR